VTIFAALN
jgi:histone deacetylase complex regulatory component SIN3